MCRPGSDGQVTEVACADEILGSLARRAYRRPINEVDLSVLRDFYVAGREDGSFDMGIQRALEMILVDPEFLTLPLIHSLS